jgi:hypothetical protein
MLPVMAAPVPSQNGPRQTAGLENGRCGFGSGSIDQGAIHHAALFRWDAFQKSSRSHLAKMEEVPPNPILFLIFTHYPPRIFILTIISIKLKKLL